MKTKIICTIGPASGSKKTIKGLIAAGMSVARINFSHADYGSVTKRIQKIKSASIYAKRSIKILGDLQGPKIRIGYFKSHLVNLKEKGEFILTAEKITGDSRIANVDYGDFYKYISENDRVFLDDGKIELKVRKVLRKKVYCEVIIGGDLSSRKGLNVLNKKLPLPGVTEKDIADLKFGIKAGIDWFAHSFVRRAEHIIEIRKIMRKLNARNNFIIAKIEDREGFENIDEIMSVSDGIMVARGDLGVSVDRALVPLMQKFIIEKCNIVNKTDIVATQMLDSMIVNPYPTRAEVNDVAVAVMQGAGYLLLSAETAVGKYPVKVTQEMARIISVIEKNIKNPASFIPGNRSYWKRESKGGIL